MVYGEKLQNFKRTDFLLILRDRLHVSPFLIRHVSSNLMRRHCNQVLLECMIYSQVVILNFPDELGCECYLLQASGGLLLAAPAGAA